MVRDHGRNYLGLQLWSGLIMLIGAALLLCLWIILVKKRKSGIFL